MLINDERPGEFGWLNNPAAVESVVKTLPKPLFAAAAPGVLNSLDETKDVYLYEIFRKVIGFEAPKGPQQIGDCVSWGWSNFLNYLQAITILDKVADVNENLASQLMAVDPRGWDAELNETLDEIKRDKRYEYEEIATEATYALSRVEVGQQHGSYQDGSVGAWAAKAVSTYGAISRAVLEKKFGSGAGKYDPQRAKKWGADGLPDDLEPEAHNHLCKVVSKVTNFKEAAAAIANLTGVPVCSNRGFTMSRDNQGFCKPQGVWNHCMLFIGVRWDRPGLLCSQSWGPNTPSGPIDKNQPDNTFWVDANVADTMLSQDDSFTGDKFDGYIKRDYVDWSH